jgi:site-specific recombinase XerD
VGSNPTGRATKLSDHRSPRNPRSYTDSRIDLRSLINGFLLNAKVEGKSPQTVSYYREKLRNFLWYAEAYGLPQAIGEITTQHIREFLAWLRDTEHRWNSTNPAANKPLSPATIRRYYASLRAMFNWAINEGLIADNAVLRIKPPKEPRKVIKALSNEGVEQLLGALDRGFEGIRNKALIMLLIDTGLRLGEVSNIALEDVDLERQTILVMGKGGKERRVRFGNKTAKALWRYMALRSKINGTRDALWLNREGDVLKANGIKLAVKRLSQRTGIKVHPHQLRHTFAIGMLRNGANPFEVQYLLGHSSLDMTRRYCQSLGFDDAYAAHIKASPMDNLKARRI